MTDIVRIIVFGTDGRPALMQDTEDFEYAVEVAHAAQAKGLNCALIKPDDPITVEEVSNGLEAGAEPAADDSPAA